MLVMFLDSLVTDNWAPEGNGADGSIQWKGRLLPNDFREGHHQLGKRTTDMCQTNLTIF